MNDGPITARERPRTASARHRAGLAAVVFAYAVVVGGVALPSPLYVAFQERWSLGHGAITVLFALYPAGVVLVLLLAGQGADALGRVTTLRLALGFGAASASVFLVADSVQTIALARVLTGFSSGFGVAAASALLVELSAPAHERTASVVSTVVNQVAIGLGALGSAVLVQYAWAPTRLVFACHLAASLVALAATWLVTETLPRRGTVSMRIQRLAIPASGRSAFAAACLAAFAAFAFCGLITALSPGLLRAELSTTNVVYAGSAIGVVFFASGASQPLWARWRDERCLAVGSLALSGALATMLVALRTGSLALFLASVAAGGVAVGALFMSSLSIVNHLTDDERRGRVTATYFAVTFSGLVLPIVLTGVAADRLSELAACALFSVAVGLVLAAAAALQPGRR